MTGRRKTKRADQLFLPKNVHDHRLVLNVKCYTHAHAHYNGVNCFLILFWFFTHGRGRSVNYREGFLVLLNILNRSSGALKERILILQTNTDLFR
jgi:hypothetical protein